MITLYGRLSSINVQKVAWTLDELALPWRHVDAGGDAGGLDAPAFRAMNPHGRVPVLEDEGRAVWESNAIVRYLCGRYGEGQLAPAGPLDRAACDQWMDWSATALQPAVMGLFWGFYRTPAAQRNERANHNLAATCGNLLQTLDAWLQTRSYIMGEALTMADIPAGTLMFRYFGMEIARPPLPAVEAWRSRLGDGEAYRSQIMRPFGELYGRLAF